MKVTEVLNKFEQLAKSRNITGEDVLFLVKLFRKKQKLELESKNIESK